MFPVAGEHFHTRVMLCSLCTHNQPGGLLQPLSRLSPYVAATIRGSYQREVQLLRIEAGFECGCHDEAVSAAVSYGVGTLAPEASETALGDYFPAYE